MENQTMNSQELHDLAALKQSHRGKGIAAIICGVISLIGCLGPISFICGIVAIIVGVVARKKSRKTTGTTGMVMGIIGVSISVICVACVVLMMGGVFGTQLADYTQKAKASQDLVLCDTIRAAITTTMLDPAVVTDADSTEFVQKYCNGGTYDVEVMFEGDNAFTESFQMLMGVDSYDELLDMLQTDDADSIEFEVQNGISVRVSIPGTDIEVQ